MSVSKTIIAIVVAVIGYQKYQKFINFIDRLKLELHVINVHSNMATLTISALNVFDIPYKIKKIDLFLNNIRFVATTSSCVVHKKIVKKSQIPINFTLIQAVSVQELEAAEIEVHYLLLGFVFRRRYNAKNNSITNPQENINSCGCGCS